MKKNNIINATFTSVWDGGYEISTDCRINLKTREIVEIKTVEDPDVEILNYEYITINSEDFPACHKDDMDYVLESQDAYWYK